MNSFGDSELMCLVVLENVQLPIEQTPHSLYEYTADVNQYGHFTLFNVTTATYLGTIMTKY
jgi:hypothetical protein